MSHFLVCVRATILIQFRTPIKKVRTPTLFFRTPHCIEKGDTLHIPLKE
jgi:hypothetical protein